MHYTGASSMWAYSSPRCNLWSEARVEVRIYAERLQSAIPRGRKGDEQILLRDRGVVDPLGSTLPRPARSPTSCYRQRHSLFGEACSARSGRLHHLPGRRASQEEKLENGSRIIGVAQLQRHQQPYRWIQQRREIG